MYINCLIRRSNAHIQSTSGVDSHSSGHYRSGSRHSQGSATHHQDTSVLQHSGQMTAGYEKPHSPKTFDMSQIQQSIGLLTMDQMELPKVSKSRSASSNGTTTTTTTSSSRDSPDPGVKKERIKTLWNKVGRHGLLQAAASKQSTNKWDQILNPLLQKQRQERLLLSEQSTVFFDTTVGGEAGSGSGFFGQPGNATMECDCGDDSCPQCNLMLNMGSGY